MTVALGAIVLGSAALAVHHFTGPVAPAETPSPALAPAPETDVVQAAPQVHTPVSVRANRGLDVPDGFLGDVHPALNGPTRVEVTATWTPIERSRLKLEAPEEIINWYTSLRPAVSRAMYTARDFSAFLPASKADVGQVWAIDPDKVKPILAQFHPRPMMHLTATGRRSGPDGAFAVLRAVSPKYAEIDFRIHAEFFVTPNTGGQYQAVYAWLTPAYFRGRLLVNYDHGTVEYFQLELPTEKSLNAFLTANPSLLNIPVLGHDIIRIDRMELAGGDGQLADRIPWAESITQAEAARKLARVFYKFEEIDWVPANQAAAKAREKNRPVLAIVSWGSTEDQSC
jgi:hypothetical protein